MRYSKYSVAVMSVANLICAVVLIIWATGCSHTIKIKGARFVPPITAEEQWSGSVSLSASADTRVTLIDDIDNNPPTRGPVRINQDVDAGDFFGLNYIGVEAGLSIFRSVELYIDNGLLGLRWQFLNHGKNDKKVVAALQLGRASGSQSSYEEESGSGKATSEIKRSQAGLSVGYKAKEHIMPYLSFLHESYDVETEVTNTSGTFGPYEDKGKHQFVALGVMSHASKFLWAIEYNHIFIDWERAEDKESQDLIAGRIGMTW